MANLRSKLIRLAHENPELRSEILPLLNTPSSKTAARDWDEIITGPKARISYTTGPYALMQIEEMHQKGKRRLRQAKFDIGGSLPRDYPNAWMMENLVMWMRPNKNMTYEKAVSAFGKAMDKAASEAQTDSRGRVLTDWSVKALKRMPTVREITSYMVEPADYTPIKAEGRDFTVSSEWGEFGSYSPSSDLQDHTPHYTKVVSKSPTSARKLYKVLKSDPDQLRSMSFDDFTKFLDKMKIAWNYQFSQWS